MSLSSASLTVLWILGSYGVAPTLGKVALREPMAVDRPFLEGLVMYRLLGIYASLESRFWAILREGVNWA